MVKATVPARNNMAEVTAAAAIDAAPKKVSGAGSYGRVDFTAEKGTEGRDDANYHERALLSSPRSVRGDRAPSSSRRSKSSASVRTESASIPSIRRSKASASGSSQSIKTDYGNGSNDIINLGKEFELGLGGSVASRRPQHSMTNTNTHPAGDRIYEMPDNSLVENNTEDDVLEPKQSDVSVLTDAKSRKSLRSILSKNKEARSRKSPGKVVSTTKPLEIQIQHGSKTVPNNHLSKKESTSVSSSDRRKQFQRRELEYWSGLSVRAAMAVMQANGSDKMAQKASNIVLDEARRQSGRERSSKMMRALSTKLTVALLEAGGDQKVASAAVLAVMTYENNDDGIKSAESMMFEDSSTIWTAPKAHGKVSDEIGSVAPSLASTIQSNRSEALSITPSIASKQRKLRSIEMQIAEKQRAIEEAELRNQEKEREYNERIEALKVAAQERLAALDAKASLLEKAGATQDDRQDIIADESKSANKDVKQEDQSSKEAKFACQNAADDFMLWWC
jgi:hypothetical protein